ncbi:MAG: PTS sugar transporter subunit IIA [Desulfobacteraceae bacterium]|nr:PTS sugar transporter subunit IIA [Desulfobacteraceae bacterium]
MKILDFLSTERIIPNMKSRDKKGVIDELAQAVANTTTAENAEIAKVLLEREQLGSTGIGDGIAIPHGRLSSIDSIIMGFGSSELGIEYDAIDDKPVNIFFLLLTPENSTGGHLKVLAQISKLLKNKQFKTNLSNAKSTQKVLEIIQEADENF